jgi:sugar/nucleoside kinase (ribokinase family)
MTGMQPQAGVFVGLSTLDVVYRVAEPPAAGRKVQATGQELAAGGPAANAAVTFAALRQAGGAPPGATTLVTALGRHPLAGQIAAELASRRVTVLDATPESAGPPAVSSAWVVEGSGERSVVSVNAGGVDATPPPSLAEIVRTAPVLLVDGHHLRLAVAAASAARGAGRLVLLDGGSWKPGLAALLALVDVAVCSADFRAPGTGSGPESAAALRHRYRVPAVAVTAGPAPIRWWQGRPEPPPAGEVTVPDGLVAGGAAVAGAVCADADVVADGEVAVPAVAARDTLGAGDVFHGALTWAFAVARPADQATLPAALGFAAAVAAVRCETAGPRGWLADPRVARLAGDWLTRP